MRHLLVPTLLLLPTLAQAQVATPLLRVGDAMPGAPAGHLVALILGINTNQSNGYAASLISSEGVSQLSHAWGNGSSPAPGSILLTEATYGPLIQTSFDSSLGVDDAGMPCIVANGTGGPAGSFESVWKGTTLIALAGDPVPSMPGMFWRFCFRSGITGSGSPYFLGDITSAIGGSVQGRGLYLGSPPAAVLQCGDFVPGLPDALADVDPNFRFSGAGTNYLTEVEMVTTGALTGSNDSALVLSGSGLMIGGSLVQDGVVIPVAAGGDGIEEWNLFEFFGVTESGSYFFTADTHGSGNLTDQVIVRDGVIIFREGDVVDGQLLASSIKNAVMNEAGQLAYVWKRVWNPPHLREALFFEDQLLLTEGDAVDWDGDGVVDPTSTISSFTGTTALGITTDGTVIFTADVNVNGLGTDVEAIFSISTGTRAVAYCFGDGSGSTCLCGNTGSPGGGCANGTFANGAKLTASGSSRIAAGSLVLSGSRLPFNQSGLYFQGDFATNGGLGAIFGDGLRCAESSAIRLQVRAADAAGNSTTTIDIGAAGGAAAGQIKRYQLWYRDPTGSPCGAGFNLSNAVEITWVP